MEGEGEGPVVAVAGEVAPQQGAQRVPPRGEFPQEPLESPLALHHDTCKCTHVHGET